MGHQVQLIRAAFALLLTISTTSVQEVFGREYNQRRQLRLQDEQQLNLLDTKIDNDSDNGNKPNDFYDLSPLTEQEKLQLIKMAYSVTEYGDSVDWDDQYDKFRDAVRQSRSQSRTKQSQSSDSEDSEGEEEKEEEEETIKSIPTSRSLLTTAQHQTRQLPKVTMKQQNLQPQQRAGNDFEGDVFDAYEYSSGNCPDAGSLGVPCAPDNLPQICNKYDRTNGSFRDCLAACEPAFCCIHDADREMNYLAPNCNTDENCGAYSMCYIAWWKLHDTIGPALFLRIVQDDEFYDITADEITDLQNDNPLFIQVLLHHWDDIDRIIAEGTEDGEFNADNIFLDPEYWESDF